MVAKVLTAKNGDWVFLAWQMMLVCIMGALMCMSFLRQGSTRLGIAAAALAVLLWWLINEALAVKYILSLSKDDEVPEDDEVKVSENWLSLRRKYNTLDEASLRGITSNGIGKQVGGFVDAESSSAETTAIPMSEMEAYFQRLQEEQPQGINR